MLNRPQRGRGVSLIELLVGLAVFAVLAALSAPSFSAWIQNLRVRTAAESIQNGLQVARTEAVRRNMPVRFQLVDRMSDDCVLSVAASNWIVSLDDPSGKCATASSETADPRILQSANAAGDTNSVKVTVSPNTQTSVSFNGMGRITPTPGSDIAISIKGNNAGDCATSGGGGGPVRCLRVEVAAGGQVRMCDPARASSDPQGC
jgi:type IV fimbrial biogenesis protein FimT